MSKEKPTFEEAVALLADKPTPDFIARNSVALHAGLVDLRDRVANLEHRALEGIFRVARLEEAHNASIDRLNTIETQHTEYKKRVAAVEAAPDINTKKTEALETRVRTVEGAVGSAGYKDALAKPNKPISPLPGEQGGPSQNPSHTTGV
jgi:hypothetical protein